MAEFQASDTRDLGLKRLKIDSDFTHGPFQLDMTMFKEHREKIASRFQTEPQEGKSSETPYTKCLLLFQGGESSFRDETDHENLFRQQSVFQYFFGVREPDCFGSIEGGTGISTLYVPRLPESYAIWMGKIQPVTYFKEYYQVDRCLYVDELPADIASYAPDIIHTVRGKNSDSGNFAKPASFDGISNYKVDDNRLFYDIEECRMIKTEKELKLLQFVNDVSSEAHLQVMKASKELEYEFQLEARFLAHCYEFGGCRNVSYTCICGCGSNSAVLHYGHAGAPNDRRMEDTDMCLLDMGAECHCWGSDITCSFPRSGSFTPKQRGIFETVQAMQFAVFDVLGPGIAWIDMHALVYRVMCEKLLALGLLRGSVDEMMDANVGAIFMPHGLGHFLGLETHDSGGYPRDGQRDPRDGFRSLRCIRTMEPGMVITVEPGVYFIDPLLDKALSDPTLSQYFVNEVIKEYRGFGGVRLEDDVVITETGIHNMTHCPRTVEDVEAVMAGRITSRHQLFKHPRC